MKQKEMNSVSSYKYLVLKNNCNCLFFMSFVKDIRVIVLDSPNPPVDIIKEVDGWSCDINKGFGGKYVYLQAIRTSDRTDAITDIRLVKVNVPLHNSNYRGDLAIGAGGDYRYLEIVKNTTQPPIRSIALWRTSKNPKNSHPVKNSHWTHASTDLNVGRGGDYLYLCWDRSIL